MPIQLLLDEDVPVLLAQVLRERGYDVVHVTEVGLSGSPDVAVLEWAVEQRRAVLTHNVRDFLALAERAAESSLDHYGILPSPQLPFGDLLRRALRTLRDRTAADLVNAVVWMA